MISFHDMGSALIAAIVLALVIIVAAALAEGRGRHLLDLARGLREGDVPEEGLLAHEVPRDEMDWSVVARLDSPTREQDGEDVSAAAGLASLKDRVSEVRRGLPALKDVPVLRALTPAVEERELQASTAGALGDTAGR